MASLNATLRGFQRGIQNMKTVPKLLEPPTHLIAEGVTSHETS